MDVLDWKLIFDKAKEHLIKPKGSGIKRAGGTGGAKKVKRTAKVKGGASKIYPCYFCRVLGYQGKQRSPVRLVEHIEKFHEFAKADAEAIQKKWNADQPMKTNSVQYKVYMGQDDTMPELKKKISLDELMDDARSDEGTPDQNALVRSVLEATGRLPPGEEKKEEKEEKKESPPAVPELPEAPVVEPPKPPKKKRKPKKGETVAQIKARKAAKESIKKTVESVKSIEKKREKKLLEEYNAPPKEPGIADLMKLMKGQQGELPPEAKTELADLGKATVKKIKTRAAKSKADQADKTNIDSKFKTLEKSKLKRVPAKEIKVVSKVKGKGKPVLLISDS